MIGMSYKLASLLFLCFTFGIINCVNSENSEYSLQDDENHYSRNLLISAPIASLISNRAKSNDKNIANKIQNEFLKWLSKPEGQDAMQFCQQFENRADIYQGCLEDIKVTGNKQIALQGALAEEEFRSKSKMSNSRKFCVASGDPHFTNYDGDYFHLQEKGIYTLMRAEGFEVQEKVRKNGQDKVGVPSCLTGLAVRYNDILTIELDAENPKSIIVNGIYLDLPRDFTMKFGGLDVRHGKQSVEWRGDKSTAIGTKIVAPNGFGVMVMGGYCGVVEINVPQTYFNNVSGICGNADGKRNENDYKNPDGQIMNVNRGARNWEMSGYYGPTTPLSKWQLAWKPLGHSCFFQVGCEPMSSVRTLTSSRKVAAPSPAPRAAPKPAPAPAPAPKAAPKPAPAQAPAPAPKAAPKPAPAPAPAPKAAPSPAPKAAPSPAPKPAPAQAPTPASKAAPAAKPKATPAQAPVSKPKATPAPAPTPASKAAPAAKPKATPAQAPVSKPKATPAPAPAQAPVSKPKATPAPAPAQAPTAKPKATPTPAPVPKAVSSSEKDKSSPTTKPSPKPETTTKTASETNKVSISPTMTVSSPKIPLKGDIIDFPIKVTCDNNFRLYVNGKFVGSGDNWQKVYSLKAKVQLGVDTIAIEGHDQGGPAAFIGVFNNINTKPSDWVCKEFQSSKPASNWNLNDFDDSTWKHPVSYGKNSDKSTVWYGVNRGSLSDLSGEAQWLWTNNYDNHDHVYCRMNQATLKERTNPQVSKSSTPKKVETTTPPKKLTDFIMKPSDFKESQVKYGWINKPNDMPSLETLARMVKSTYTGSKETVISGYKILLENKQMILYLKDNSNLVIVAIRGTKFSSVKDVFADISIIHNGLHKSQRYKDDRDTLMNFQQKHSNNKYKYYAVGHSLSGAIIDIFIENGLISNSVSFNPAVEKADLAKLNNNHRVYLSCDPLYNILGKYITNGNIRVLPMKKPISKAMRICHSLDTIIGILKQEELDNSVKSSTPVESPKVMQPSQSKDRSDSVKVSPSSPTSSKSNDKTTTVKVPTTPSSSKDKSESVKVSPSSPTSSKSNDKTTTVIVPTTPASSKDRSDSVKVSPSSPTSSKSNDKTTTVKVPTTPSSSKDRSETTHTSKDTTVPVLVRPLQTPSSSATDGRVSQSDTKSSGSASSSSSSSWFASWFSSSDTSSDNKQVPASDKSSNNWVSSSSLSSSPPSNTKFNPPTAFGPFVLDKPGSTSTLTSKKYTNNTHHLNLRENHHTELIKNLKVFRTESNYTTACIASYLYVKYDGRGSVFVAGADKNKKVHQNRADCNGKNEGFQKVLEFNPNDVSYFSIDVETSFEGHLDCGGSAFWNAQKKREFTQICSWNSFGAKNPIITTKVILYTTPTAVEKIEEILKNDLMGQWYLLAERNVHTKERQCLVATIFRHDSDFFMKHSINKGKQTYSITDHPIQSFAIDSQLFKMDGQVYSYKLSEFKTTEGKQHILLLKNINNDLDERVFGDKIYSKSQVEKLIKHKYKNLKAIEQKCYTD